MTRLKESAGSVLWINRLLLTLSKARRRHWKKILEGYPKSAIGFEVARDPVKQDALWQEGEALCRSSILMTRVKDL